MFDQGQKLDLRLWQVRETCLTCVSQRSCNKPRHRRMTAKPFKRLVKCVTRVLFWNGCGTCILPFRAFCGQVQ